MQNLVWLVPLKFILNRLLCDLFKPDCVYLIFDKLSIAVQRIVNISSIGDLNKCKSIKIDGHKTLQWNML